MYYGRKVLPSLEPVMNRRIEALRKDLIEKITELVEARSQYWKRVEFSNSSIYHEEFYCRADCISIEVLCEFLDGLDGIIPIRIVS